MALRDIIPLMELIQEIRKHKFDIINTQPYVYCKVFEDNSGALELAQLPRLCHVPSILMYATIISGNMFKKA